jgi:hypothetical protein
VPGWGGGDLLREAQEFLVRVPRVAGVRRDLAGSDLEGGEQGGVVRSSAWIWDFSSTLTALSRGERYRPATSRIFGSSSGSVLKLKGLVAVRLDAPFPPGPGPGHGGEGGAQVSGQEQGRPVRDLEPSRPTAVIRQRRRDDLDLIDLGRPAAARRRPGRRSRQAITAHRDTPARGASVVTRASNSNN